MAAGSKEAGSRVLPGGYTVGATIDTGSFARVFHGQTADGRAVAIKVLKSEHAQARKRFAREIKVMQAMPENPHVVQYIDHGETSDGTPFIVLEYLDGITLGKLLHSGVRLTESAACALMFQLCDSFGGLHRLGVTHGDIKPNNIMLSWSDGVDPKELMASEIIHIGTFERSGFHITLLDFGLVRDAQGLLRLFEEHNFLPGHDFEEDIDAGMLTGTPEYIAPEQVADARHGDPALTRTDTPSDVFGLGVIFFELLSGRSPWPFRPNAVNAEQYKQQTKAYLDERVGTTEPPVQLSNIAPALWSIIARALHPDPKLRQGDAKTLAADIRRYVRYGVGIPADLDQEETIMAYLGDLPPIEEPAPHVDPPDPRGPRKVGTFRRQVHKVRTIDPWLVLYVGIAVVAGLLVGWMLS